MKILELDQVPSLVKAHIRREKGILDFAADMEDGTILAHWQVSIDRCVIAVFRIIDGDLYAMVTRHGDNQYFNVLSEMIHDRGVQ